MGMMEKFSNISGSALWGALSAVAGFLTGRMGVPIVRAQGAATDNKVIYLPPVADSVLTWDEVLKVIGYLYHEAAHILWTDFSIGRATVPLVKSLEGKLEDIRIEHRAIHHFPAARRYLGELVRVMTEQGLKKVYPCFSAPADEATEAEVLQWYLLYRLRHDYLGQTDIAPVHEATAALAKTKLPRGMKVKLDALMFQIARCENTQDVRDLAEAIASMIAEEEQKEREEQQKQQQQQQQSSSDDQPGAPSGSSGDQQDDPSQGADQASGQDDSQDDSQASPSSAQKDSSDAPDDGTGASASGSGDDDAGDPGQNADALSRILSMTDSDATEDIGEALKQAVQNVADESQRRTGAVAMPNRMPLTLTPKSVDMTTVRGAVNAVRTKTLGWMQSETMTAKSNDPEGELLDPTMLWSVPLGGDVFMTEEEERELNGAIHLVIDRSVSMRQCIDMAAGAALTTALAFEVPGIKTQVSVFPVVGQHHGCSVNNGVAILKTWDEPNRKLASCIGSLNVAGCTPMAEAILLAASDTAQREESLKLIVVATDGDPDDADATREVIAKVRKAGIKVVAIGIGMDPSPVFGENYSGTISSIGELSGAMLKVVKAAIKSR